MRGKGFGNKGKDFENKGKGEGNQDEAKGKGFVNKGKGKGSDSEGHDSSDADSLTELLRSPIPDRRQIPGPGESESQ